MHQEELSSERDRVQESAYMSSAIFYRFKSQKEFSRISFDGSHMGLTVFDIKRDIIQTEKLGSGADFDLRISNADSGNGMFTTTILIMTY